RAHVHLTQKDVETLYGEGHQLTVLRDLGQAGQFACKETVNVVGPKGVLQNVRIIGPARVETQIELARTDTYVLGIDAPLRNSGSLAESPGAVLIGSKGTVVLDHGCVIARSHIHMLESKARDLDIADHDKVSVLIKGEKTVCYHDVLVRMVPDGLTEFHIDTDEANAAYVDTGDLAMIKHKEIVIRDNFGNVLDVNTDNIKFVQGKLPHDYYSQEGIRLLRTVFEYPASVGREIAEKMLNPDKLAPNKYYLFTALDNDKAVGIACFYYMPGVNMAYLEHIGITPEYRNRGIGSFFYHKVISVLEKNHPEIEGVLLEVRPHREELDNRKDFFLNIGAIPVDTSFYPSDMVKSGQEVLLMFIPETVDARLTTPTMELALHTLSKIL
ncbi:MAG: phosphate propanoyltransferase, partial [Peptococcaceae bacterium]|nr:phosphate propanoyltransferase [Peptococcaceae bacterium]